MNGRKTLEIALVALLAWGGLMAAPSVAQAQEDQPRRARVVARAASPSLCDVDPSAHAVEDVRAKVARMRIGEDGPITISRTDSGLRLVGFALGGSILEYAVVGADGGPVTSLSAPTTSADCNPCCWKCGKDGGGTVHCWQVPCPVITSGEGDEG